MRDFVPLLAFVGWFCFVLAVVTLVQRLRSKKIALVAEAIGMADVRRRFFGDIIAQWRGYNVKWMLRGGGRNGPERAVIEITAATPARLVIRKRLRWNFDVSLFGPPLIQTPTADAYVVRSDDLMLAERVLTDEFIMAMLPSVIDERFDELSFATSRVRVINVTRSKSLDEGFRAAWQLASTVVERLGLPPAG